MSKLIFRVLVALTVIFLAEMPVARRSRTRGFSSSTSRRRQTYSNNEGGDVNIDVSTDSGDDSLVVWLSVFGVLIFLCSALLYLKKCIEDDSTTLPTTLQFDTPPPSFIESCSSLYHPAAKDDDDGGGGGGGGGDGDDDGQDSHDVSTTAAKDDDDDSGGVDDDDDDGQDRHDVSTAIGTDSASISDDSSHDPTMHDNIACKEEEDEQNFATVSQAKFSPGSRGGSSTSELNDTIPRERDKEDNVDSTLKGKEPTDVGQEHVTHKPTSPHNQQQTEVFICKSQPESVKPNTSRFCDDASLEIRIAVDQ